MGSTFNPSMIRLNIGGMKFCTTLDTLTCREPDSMLAAMFSGRHSLSQDSEKGVVFVDRDGKHFRHILNWLRDGVVPKLSDHKFSELLREAEYYQLLGLIDKINDAAVLNGRRNTDFTHSDIVKCLQFRRGGFRGAHLSGLDLSNLDLSAIDFSYAFLENVSFSGANLHGALFEGAKLENANLRDAYLQGCNFNRSDLRSACLQSANLTFANLDGANLEGADLERADINASSFYKANLVGANFRDVDIRFADVKGTTLEKVQNQLLSYEYQ